MAHKTQYQELDFELEEEQMKNMFQARMFLYNYTEKRETFLTDSQKEFMTKYIKLMRELGIIAMFTEEVCTYLPSFGRNNIFVESGFSGTRENKTYRKVVFMRGNVGEEYDTTSFIIKSDIEL